MIRQKITYYKMLMPERRAEIMREMCVVEERCTACLAEEDEAEKVSKQEEEEEVAEERRLTWR